MRKKALTIEEREIQVINWFVIRLQHDNDDYASLYQIAKGVGLSPSSHLRNIVEKMVSGGQLESSALERSGRWTGRGYRLKRGNFKRPPKQALIVNFTRKGERQMELL